ncbi:MAG: M48 family metallopeptidase [Patescibacteria group bacterium]
MATTYDFVAANKRRSALLIAVFVVVIVAVGWVFMKLLGYGPIGLVIAVIVAVGMSLVGYYSGDKIALATAGAQGPIKKEDQAYLYTMVENLCIAAGLPMPRVYLMNDPQINAFATGRGPERASIAVTTGAIEQLENEELEGVLAHELSHVKNYDVRYMTLVAILVGILTLLSNYFWRASFFGGRRRGNDSGGGQLQAIFMIIGLVLIIIAPILGQLIQLAVSRKREFLADASGTLLTRYPEGLARALEKIGAATDAPLDHANQATAHLYISNPFGPQVKGFNKLFSTHPPIAERVKALRAMDHSPA